MKLRADVASEDEVGMLASRWHILNGRESDGGGHLVMACEGTSYTGMPYVITARTGAA